MPELNDWFEAHRMLLNIGTMLISLGASGVYVWCVWRVAQSNARHSQAMFALFVEARETLINASTRGLEERLNALERIVMEDHLQRIERAARPPAESEGR